MSYQLIADRDRVAERLDRQPVLPRYEALEVLQPGEWIEPDGHSLGSGGDVIAPCSCFIRGQARASPRQPETVPDRR
jgi:hypothetical protein